MSTSTRLGIASAVILTSGVRAAPPAERPAPPTIKAFTTPYPTVGSIERLDPALDKILPPDARLEMVAEGFDWAEGPVWIKQGGYLLFSDIPPNAIYKWQEGKGVTTFRKPAGYDGARTDLAEPGTNGLAIDKAGKLVMCQHGNRRLARLESLGNPQGAPTPLAERYDGKRFNSPNDLVVHSSGDIFFTDPPYGLAKQEKDPEKELKFQGVYFLGTRGKDKGKTSLLTEALERPNGIALSPDEKTLYVANSYEPRSIWMAFDLKPDRSLANGRVFFDSTPFLKAKRPGLNDGMTVDATGNLFATGPGGVLILSPQGKHLGTLLTGQRTANCKFGGDGKTLYITADSQLLRIRTTTKGLGF